jgi:hypothetical protein
MTGEWADLVGAISVATAEIASVVISIDNRAAQRDLETTALLRQPFFSSVSP